MKKSQNVTELEELAASQWGMFTTAQAQELGVRRNQVARMVSAGRVESVGYGVYCFAVGNETDSADVKAAWLSVYPKEFAFDRMKKKPYDAVVAERTAAAMHDIGDFYASPYTFAVDRRKQTNRENMRYLRRAVDESDVVFVDDLPVTSIERTICDLIESHEDPNLVDELMSDAARKRGYIFDRRRLSELLAPLAFRNGFKKGDGESFAASLISRNVADVQIESAAKTLAQVLELAYGQDDMRKIQAQMRAAIDTLVSTNALKDSREDVEGASPGDGNTTSGRNRAKRRNV
ncbi:MAG: type IV toxin-antitoxin system AbiEi family antitoxin domain-containing protein [Eggerthellaceae bacterium]|nr:type IV toxin-antitoxin system AbiEi family antitoxin domain-containing protein [Eggerthellaceae bacterium]